MQTTKVLKARKRIALIAHDHKKAELIEWAIYNKTVLSRHELYATGTTGQLIEQALDVSVRKLMSGPLGGDQQIGALVARGSWMLLFSSGTPWKPYHTTRTLRHYSV